MADKQSREADNVLYKCIECDSHTVIKNGVDSKRCFYCDGMLDPMSLTNLDVTNHSKKTINYGMVTVDIDVSDALTGLKAVQREARKATRSLRELEEQQKKVSYGCDCNA